MVLPAGGCAGLHRQPADRPTTVTGKVYYPQRIALPPGTRLTVQLLDVSDVRSPRVLARHTETVGPQTPVPFTLRPRAPIAEDGIYQVRATLELPDGGRWGHFAPAPVLTRGAPSHVEIRVHPLP